MGYLIGCVGNPGIVFSGIGTAVIVFFAGLFLKRRSDNAKPPENRQDISSGTQSTNVQASGGSTVDVKTTRDGK